jgi:hypothetical protein
MHYNVLNSPDLGAFLTSSPGEGHGPMHVQIGGMYIHVYVCAFMYVYIYVYIYMYVYIYTYIYIYTCLYVYIGH